MASSSASAIILGERSALEEVVSREQSQLERREKFGDWGLSISSPALGHATASLLFSTLNNFKSRWTQATMTDYNENLRKVRRY